MITETEFNAGAREDNELGNIVLNNGISILWQRGFFQGNARTYIYIKGASELLKIKGLRRNFKDNHYTMKWPVRESLQEELVKLYKGEIKNG